MHKKLTERNLLEMLKIALVFLHESGEYSRGIFEFTISAFTSMTKTLES